MVSEDSLHLLSIDLSEAPSDVQRALSLEPDAVAYWLARARALGAPLAVVHGACSVNLYSTEAGRRAAFRPLLESLWTRGRHSQEFHRVRTLEATGAEAVRRLLRLAVGLDSPDLAGDYTRAIESARAAAQAAGTFSQSLAEVFELALITASRSLAETEIGAPTSTSASREVEALGAERIVEEEVLAFRAAVANDPGRISSAPPARPHSSLPPYGADETGSVVRLRLNQGGLPSAGSKPVRARA